MKNNVVNCYAYSIIGVLEDCNALMRHFNQSNPKDTLFAIALLSSLQMVGKTFYLDFYITLFLDDKLGQKYILEKIDAPVTPSHVFNYREITFKCVRNASFPMEFKLSRGSGSSHIKLTETQKSAEKFVKKAFIRWYPLYNKMANLQKRWYKYSQGMVRLKYVLTMMIASSIQLNLPRSQALKKNILIFRSLFPVMNLKCEGYWNEQLNCSNGSFNIQGWMVEAVLRQLKQK